MLLPPSGLQYFTSSRGRPTGLARGTRRSSPCAAAPQSVARCYARNEMEPLRRRSPATYEDLLAVPDHMVAELVDGELYASPRPAPRHADAASVLGGVLNGPFDRGRGGPGGWRILFKPEIHLERDVLVPDLAGWRRERLPSLPTDAYFSISPDWVCEVLSSSTAALDRVKKLTVYAREHVGYTWLVDPSAQTIEVLRLDNGRWMIDLTVAGAGVVRLPPFGAVDVDLTSLWELPPQTS